MIFKYIKTFKELPPTFIHADKSFTTDTKFLKQ
jgi:hypothetical protein